MSSAFNCYANYYITANNKRLVGISVAIIVVIIRVQRNSWSPYETKNINSVTENKSEEL